MLIRTVREDDTEKLFDMMCRLDGETEYMLYEPGERRLRGTGPLRANVEAAVRGEDLFIVAEDSSAVAGFLWAQRGRLARTRHSAYIVTGILSPYRRQGIGTEFFEMLEKWALAEGIVRLELNVAEDNPAAIALYEKQGFCSEGIKQKAIKRGTEWINEIMMSRILH